MVLFIYCFILNPRNQAGHLSPALLVFAFAPPLSYPAAELLSEFYVVASLLICIGVILFVVMLSVVDLVDFARGSLRVEYDKFAALWSANCFRQFWEEKKCSKVIAFIRVFSDFTFFYYGSFE
jgi:hypothetical protein